MQALLGELHLKNSPNHVLECMMYHIWAYSM